jgi:hypothetical protein
VQGGWREAEGRLEGGWREVWGGWREVQGGWRETGGRREAGGICGREGESEDEPADLFPLMMNKGGKLRKYFINLCYLLLYILGHRQVASLLLASPSSRPCLKLVDPFLNLDHL